MNCPIRFATCAMAVLTALSLSAFPGGPRGPHGGFRGGPPPRHHHHHHGSTAIGVGAGILGAGILAATIYDATHPRPVVVAPAPVVTPAPVVVQQPVVVQPTVVQPVGHYETRVQNVWVEGRYVDQVGANGVMVRVWQPGHYEQQTTQVYVP